MDEFGVLTERFGLKPQGKSAPMASSKRQPPTTQTTSNLGQSRNWGGSNSNLNSMNDHDFLFPSKKAQSFDDSNDVFGDFFQKSTTKQPHDGFGYDPIFANSGGDDDIFGLNSSNVKSFRNDDIFDLKSSNVNSFKIDDIFGSLKETTSPVVDDLLGDFGSKSKISSRNGSAKAGFDDLIPGFGSTVNGFLTCRRKAETAKSSSVSADDPFGILESTFATVRNPVEGGKKPGTLRPPPKPAQVVKADKVKSPSESAVDELEDFAMGRVRNNVDGQSKKRQGTKASRYNEAEDASAEPHNKGVDDLESFFAASFRSSSVPRSRDANLDSVFDEKRNDRKSPQMVNKSTVRPPSSVKKPTPVSNMVDDFSSIFFGGASMFGEFEEVEGESEERRKARMGRQQRTHHRMAQAVADMNQRERQTQQEQEEKSRIADAVDLQIKRWAAGKEGNMRALLSSLQQVLWPECGWEPVSLTDLITSTSVKKVYRKATLFVHPDKVQQKGATLHQKYIAEKVFDILKEAWNKFNAEELR
ncbi:uncharacterized protein [Rutidosis leptorrhynchoides]|uniref:uncharacterized protein n=1 Tax=Rutidosis leptorrhynchoides TaxID=125765 RepID=UPI003A98CE4C